MKIINLIIIIKWLTSWYTPSVTKQFEAIDELFFKIHNWAQTKGDLWVISHLKAIRLLYTRHLVGDPMHTTSHIIGIRKDGLPKGLPLMNDIWLVGDKSSIVFVLTVLSVSRAIHVWGKPSTSSITSPYTGKITDFTIFDGFIRKFRRKMKLPRGTVTYNSESLYYSTKAGPNGLATWMSSLDASAIFRLYPRIKEAFHNLSFDLWFAVSGQKDISQPVIDWFSRFQKTKGKNQKDSLQIRKLSVIKDPEGKSRIIAIMDYYTQVILKDIHEQVFKMLEKLPCDRTFTQDPVVNFPGPYHSLDLKSATDRFPLAFQMRVVKEFFSDDISKNWATLLTEYGFTVPWLKDTQIKYEVGQPMGAYSSWAIFALSHHIVVQYAADLIGEFPTRNYILLGDDIVIGGDKLANSYRKCMLDLGVEISIGKTHRGLDSYEFAKRWFHKGVEVSGIQCSAFLETKNNWSLLYQTFRLYLDRGYVAKGFTPIRELLSDLLLTFGAHKRLVANIARKVEQHHALYRWIKDGYGETLRNVMVNSYPLEAPIPDQEHPYFEDWIFMRLNITHQKLYDKLEKLLLKYIEEVDNQLVELLELNMETMPNWEKLDQVNHIDELISGVGPGFIASHPISVSLRTLYGRMANNEAITSPQRDYNKAVEALCIPVTREIGKSRKSHQLLFVQSKLALELFKTNKTLFRNNGPGWMFEAQYEAERNPPEPGFVYNSG